MCARKISAVAGDARTALDVCRRAVEAIESDTRRQLKLGILSSVLHTPISQLNLLVDSLLITITIIALFFQ